MYEVFSWNEQQQTGASNAPVRVPVRRSVTPGSERSLHKRYSLAVAPHSTIDLDGESGHTKPNKSQATSAPPTPNTRHSAAVGAMSMSVCGERGYHGFLDCLVFGPPHNLKSLHLLHILFLILNYLV